MGSCYSHQSQHQGKYSQPLEQPAKSSDNHSSMMPHPTAASEAGPDKARAVGTATQKGRQSGFGFRMPHMGRYNNNKPSRRGTEPSGIDEQNSTATNMSNGDGEGKTTDRCIKEPLIKSANKRNKARDKGRPRDNGFAASSESLTSLSSNGRGRGSKLSSKQSSLKRAYIPRSNTSSWRMIDDSSSAYSGKSGDKLLDRNNRSENTTPGLSLDDLSNGNTTASSTPAKAALIIKAPIAIVESLETLSGGSKEDAASRNPSPRKASDISSSYDKGSRVNRATAGSFQSRLRGPFKKYGPVTSTSKPEAKQTNQLSIGSQGNKWVKAKPEQNKNAGKRVIPNRAILQKQKSIDQELPEKEIIPQVDIKTTNPVNGIKVGKSKTAKLISSEDDIEKEISVIKEEPVKPVHTKPSSQVPALSPDALDTISIGSINSDDLMLDIDLDEYEELGSPPSMEPSKHSRTRSRSRSRSRENPHRKSLNGGSNEKSTDKCAGPKEQSESGIPAPQTKLVCMGPLKELATLVQVSNASVPTTTQRRQQRRATRPASFPGPRSDGTPTADVGHGVTTILKPPRQGSVYADDDDMVTIDGFTYRHLVQDVTNFKTMLLKLKRVIQEDEFHGQNWKNGFKLSSSQPTSPYDDSNKYSFAAYLERDEHIQNNSNTDDVIKENSELKLQLQGIRHQVEEQERTIMLLQQQMTKYECGYSEPGGKAYSHVATQTDKQVSGFYKAGSYRSACVRRSSSTSSQPLSRYGNRTEFREISRNSITDEVFMDLESCDNDDDLDLLMEEVSLGSVCLSSVGDNFSQCGERSMSVASNHPGSVSRRSSFAARDQPYFYQQDSSHRDGPANHDIVNILCRKDPETYPGLEASDTFTVEHAKPQNGKCKIHFCETKAMQYQDSETGDCEDTVFMSSPKHPKTSTDETDENTDIGGKNTSAEYDGIPSANGSSSFSVHHRQSLSGQSDCSAQSHKADSFLTQEKEGCSFNWLSATDSVSELGYQSAASIAQLDDEVSELGDGRSTTSEQQQAAENNNTVLVMSESDDKKHSADKVQHVLKKQQCLQEPEDNVAIKSAGQSEQEPKKSARSLKFPSGRITKWSNPKPSIKPPPRPIQPPTKLDIMKQSQSVDSIRFGLPSQSSATIAEGPVEGAISEQAQRAGVLVGGAKSTDSYLVSHQYNI